MAKKGFSFSKTAVWALMALLILGLGGFGAINLSGNLRSIGSVGDKSISVDQYARQLQQEIRAIEAQTGESLSFARAQEMGLDRAVLQRIVRMPPCAMRSWLSRRSKGSMATSTAKAIVSPFSKAA